MVSNRYVFDFWTIVFLVIMIGGLVISLAKLKKPTIGYAFATMIITYVVLAVLNGGGVVGVFSPTALFGMNDAKTLFLLAILSGVCYAGITWIIRAANKKSFDVMLGIFSFIIPFVGLVLCIVNRAKKEKDIPASNAYLILPITGSALGLFIVGVLGVFELL